MVVVDACSDLLTIPDRSSPCIHDAVVEEDDGDADFAIDSGDGIVSSDAYDF